VNLSNDSDNDACEPSVSIAIPIFNEESVVPELLRRTLAVLDKIPGEHEIVLVDDGSTDGTLAILEEAVQKDARINVVALSRNFGHQRAISAALDYCSGDVVVVMDGDLQDTPESIPLFLDKYAAGYDVVYAIRVHRKETFFKRICYKLFYRTARFLADVDLPLDSGDFSLMSRRVVDLLRQSPERQRFLRGLRTWYGFRQVGLVTERAARHSGDTKYSWNKLLRLAFDGIFAFSIVPLRLAMLTGLLAVCCSLVYAVYALYVRLVYPGSDYAPTGFTALIFTVTFLSGTQLLFAGVLGEYVGRIYEEVKQRPHYVVRKTIGVDK